MHHGQYGVAKSVRIPLTKRAVVDFAVGADWTPVAGDVKISKDGGAFANVTNLPTVLASANTGAVWVFALTATEMQAAEVVVVISDAATKAVEDTAFIVETLRFHSGTAQAGGASTITLAAGASAVDDFYKGWMVTIIGGAGGYNKTVIITGYVGSTKVATVSPAWSIVPDNTSAYVATA